MKSRNREISIFSLSLMDVISGAMGAFLIVMVIQARYTAVVEGDPEKLRPRLDAAMEALAGIRAGTEKTIAENYVETVTPKSQGLSGGETVPEITALGQALRADIEKIREGFARTLQERGAATRALADASDGTEKTFKAHMSRSRPATLGLKRGNSVPEITALGEALREDIGDIEKALDETINQRNAAASYLSIASAGTEKVVKDRIGAKPKTLGLARGVSVPEIEKLGGALKADIDTIYKEFRKGKESDAREQRKDKEDEPNIPFGVTSVFPCDSGDVSLQIASNETDPETGKPRPPYTPVPKRFAIPVGDDSWALVNSSLHGSGADYLLRQPAFTYLNSRAVPGRHYKVYLIGFTSACRGHVMMLGRSAVTGAHGRSLGARFSKGERVSLSWPRDSIVLSDGKRYGMYYLGTITVSKDHRLSFARASESARVAELKAIQERVDDLRRQEEKKADNLPPTREAVLAKIDKLPVPGDVPSCGRMFGEARRALEEMKLMTGESSAALHAVLEDCRTNRFPDALAKLKAEMHRVLAGKKDGKPPLTEKKEEKPPPSREAALAAIDRLPVPNDKSSCVRLVHLSARTLNEMKISPAQSRAMVNEIMRDCSSNRFQDAQQKLKAAMHRLLE